MKASNAVVSKFLADLRLDRMYRQQGETKKGNRRRQSGRRSIVSVHSVRKRI